MNALQRCSTTFRNKFVSRKNEGKTARAKNSGFILERTVLFDNTHIPILWDVDDRSALPRMFANLRNCWALQFYVTKQIMLFLLVLTQGH